jgi:hypothetical protein
MIGTLTVSRYLFVPLAEAILRHARLLCPVTLADPDARQILAPHA